MYRKIRVLITTIAMTLSFLIQVRGQSRDVRQTEDVLKVTLLNPGLNYEKSIAPAQTINGHVFLATSVQYSYSSALGTNFDIYFDPAISADYRYYYNLHRRAGKGRNTSRNSANYLAFTTGVLFSKMPVSSSYYEEANLRPVITPGILWGVQRNYNNRISLDIKLGVGYRIARGTEPDLDGVRHTTPAGRVQLLADVDLGIWLNRRRS